MGWDLAAPLKWRHSLEAAGFTDIHIQWFNWPVGPWAKQKKNKLIGKLTFMNFFDLFGSVGPLCQKFLNYTAEETETLIAQSRKEMREQKLHFYQPICFCYAKKPGSLPTEVESKTAPATAVPGDAKDVPAGGALMAGPVATPADAQTTSAAQETKPGEPATAVPKTAS